MQGPFVFLAWVFGACGANQAEQLPRILGGKLPGGMAQAWSNTTLRMGAVAIFVYVGAEVAIGSYMVGYRLELGVDGAIRETPWLASMASLAASISGKTLAGMDAKGLIGALLTFYWGGAMIGRFGICTDAKNCSESVARFVCFGSSGPDCIEHRTSGVVALLALIGVGLFNSIMFPTIFTLGIGELGDLKPFWEAACSVRRSSAGHSFHLP